jgi:hypothetical protein
LQSEIRIWLQLHHQQPWPDFKLDLPLTFADSERDTDLAAASPAALPDLDRLGFAANFSRHVVDESKMWCVEDGDGGCSDRHRWVLTT